MSKRDEKARPKNPRSHRLPPEKGALILPPDDGLTPIDKAQAILRDRLEVTKRGFFLDGRPVDTYKVLDAAGITLKDCPPI